MMAPRAGTDLSGATCVLGRVNGAGASTYEPRCSVERVSFQKRKDAGSAGPTYPCIARPRASSSGSLAPLHVPASLIPVGIGWAVPKFVV